MDNPNPAPLTADEEGACRWEAWFATSADGLVLLDEHGRCVEANPAAGRLLGYPRAELLQQRLWDLVPSDTHDELRARWPAFLQAGQAAGEWTAVHKDGAPRSIAYRLTAGFRPGLHLANFQDITERKQAEALSRRAAERTTALLRVAGAFNARLDLPRVIDTVCVETARVMNVPVVTVWLYDEEREVYQYAGGCGVPVDLASRLRLVPRAFQDAYIDRLGPIFVIPDSQSIPEAPNREMMRSLDIRTNVFVTMAHEGRRIGYLRVSTVGHDRVFSAEELDLLRGLADQSALALQNARLFAAVSEHRERLRALSAQLVEAQEAERRHIARELHDEIGQQLTGLQVALEVGSRPLPPQARAGLGQARALAQQLLDQVHDLSLALRPSMLDDLGLLPALLWHFERFTQQTGLPVHFEQHGAERRFSPQVETVVYRIIQEALTNAARHAAAPDVHVGLSAEAAHLRVRIADAGAGFDPAAALAAHASSGLSGMRERAELLGGRLQIESAPGAGTRILLELPLQ